MKPLFLAVFLLMGSFAAVGAQDTRVFPRQRLEELREEVVYEPPQVQAEREPVEFKIDWEAYRSPLTIALAIIVISALGVLTYLIMGGLRLRRPPPAETDSTAVETGELVEEELVEHGVDANLLERAERAGQYDVAVRLHYISLLKSLRDSGAITYRRDYSNRLYLRQLAGSPLWGDFRSVTSTYERYWYGKYRIDRLSYRLAVRDFTALNDQLRDAFTNNTRA